MFFFIFISTLFLLISGFQSMAYLTLGVHGTSVTSHVAEEYSGEIGLVKARFTTVPNVRELSMSPRNVTHITVQVSFKQILFTVK